MIPIQRDGRRPLGFFRLLLFSLIGALLIHPVAGDAAESDLWRLLKGDLTLTETVDRDGTATGQEFESDDGAVDGSRAATSDGSAGASVDGTGDPAEAAKDGWRLHRVSAGETLFGIARSHGLTVEELRQRNELKNGLLQPGQALRVPASGKRTVGEASREMATGATIPALPSRGAVLSSMLTPLDGVVTSPFGPRRGAFHHGIDIAGDRGETIRAAQRGRILFAGWKPIYGRTVIVEHPYGVVTLYAHAQKVLVREGDEVERGQPIAQVGATGVATGPHLHFEVRLDSRTVNPATYLRGVSTSV
ncbi:peptidoglycan DD-metalloendopeptidase family protein [Heliobacterium gestii]|uniref:Peptidoglycan DD-metalloendopeptidase family protein n=1 Tax=Heliomicrobium gestii TaxID=2699 RepID=A0A845LCT6_HELGE|nr:M23 family metallopeptidase [Heliomicrobium gestii]MBM7866546.1 murein DD-endopeptidase MepM/ murein hydrolase activator NlpD [Heliomicrobium gestii]MZP43174.1 peptidoglycan DD-metalloendopeptidase family protein [Heliomicrobium gestii]